SFEAYVKSLTANYGLEKYKIMISTTNTEEASFTMLGSVSTAPVNWTKITRDLSAYDGQEVYIALVYVGYDNFIFFADDIKITTTPTAIETNNLELEARIFPNPANDVININYVEGAKIQIFNNIGQEVYSLANANEYNQIDMSAHQAGSYVVRVTKGDKTNNYKMILVK
ncbi:MAG: choice-of-anchor J domain-containing protein, partial [Bacteroidota bacterium]|nr:choice-of-anchor J domain-containing protein [Bacteroidota bacterium]